MSYRAAIAAVLVFIPTVLHGSVERWAELDCWQISTRLHADLRSSRNGFKGIYVGRLEVDKSKEEIRFYSSTDSSSGPEGTISEGHITFRFLPDPFGIEIPRGGWLVGMNGLNKGLLVLDPKSGRIVLSEINWTKSAQEPYTYKFDGFEGLCERRGPIL